MIKVHPHPFTECSGEYNLWRNGRLRSDGTGNHGQDLMSPNCKYRLRMNGDGNIVLHQQDTQGTYSIVKWKSDSQGQGTPPYRLIMQGDNNIVLYDSQSNPLWETYTSGQGPSGGNALLHDDGSFVVYDGQGEAIWSINGQATHLPASSHSNDDIVEVYINEDVRALLSNVITSPPPSQGTSTSCDSLKVSLLLKSPCTQFFAGDVSVSTTSGGMAPTPTTPSPTTTTTSTVAPLGKFHYGSLKN